MMISDLMPHLASVADELCLLRAMSTDSDAHALAILQLHTGVSLDARPSMGSWISYGLGTENQNLPSFITIHPGKDVRNLWLVVSARDPSGDAPHRAAKPQRAADPQPVRS